MNLSFANLLGLARITLQSPAQAVAFLRGLDLPMVARWSGFWFVAVMSAILVHLDMMLQPIVIEGFLAQFIGNPFLTAVLQAGFLLLTVTACTQVGRLFGGTASFADTLLVLTWMQTLLIGLQILQIVLAIILPPLGNLLSLVTLVMTFWLMTHFVAALHGCRSHGLVFLGVILTLVGMVVLLAVFLALIFGPQLGV